MNKSLESFSPTVLPLNYDALANSLGCQNVNGVKQQQFNSIIECCVATHDQESEIFNRNIAISYCLGPAVLDTPGSLDSQWGIWSATAGIRCGILAIGSIVLPDDTDGNPSTAYPSTISPKVSSAFDENGNLTIAIQKTESLIEVSRSEGPLDLFRASFNGLSPVLFYDGLLFFSNISGLTDVGCFYLNGADTTKIYLRLERDDYATEYMVLDEIQAPLQTLISVEKTGQTFTIYARDIFGNDVTLESSIYSLGIYDSGTLGISLSSGNYAAVAEQASPPQDNDFLSISISDGAYVVGIDKTTLPTENNSLSISIVGGTYA